MGVSKTSKRKALWVAPLVTALLVVGCAGIKLYEPRDYRQEGLERGLYTGSAGEWVIYRKIDKPGAGSEAGNRSDKTANGGQQKVGGEEKKKEIKNNEQQP